MLEALNAPEQSWLSGACFPLFKSTISPVKHPFEAKSNEHWSLKMTEGVAHDDLTCFICLQHRLV